MAEDLIISKGDIEETFLARHVLYFQDVDKKFSQKTSENMFSTRLLDTDALQELQKSGKVIFSIIHPDK